MKKLWKWHVEHLENTAYFFISALVVAVIVGVLLPLAIWYLI